MKTVEEYLKQFPNASLAQYKEYCDSYKRKDMEIRQTSKERYEKWLESMEGKWFVINFNNESYALMQYTKHNANNVYPRSYHFFKNHTDVKIYDEASVRLNPLWLNDLNPYTNDHLPVFQRTSSVVWAKQVSEEFAKSVIVDYNKNIKDFYETFIYNVINFTDLFN